jgi:TatA/E family protein of Tat protein translocase
MFDIGFQELVLIFIIALLVFGPKRLPELGRALGRAMREFQRASEEFRSTVEANLRLNEPDPVPPNPAPTVAERSPPTPVHPAAGPEPGSRLDVCTVKTMALAEPYVAQRGGRLFHARGRGWTGRIQELERVYFSGLAEAKEQGLVPCPVCEPWESEEDKCLGKWE